MDEQKSGIHATVSANLKNGNMTTHICHGMTFSDLSFHQFTLSRHHSWTNSFYFTYFNSSDIRKAKPKRHLLEANYQGGPATAHVVLASPTHYNVAAVPQLLHVIGVAPVHHDLQAC